MPIINHQEVVQINMKTNYGRLKINKEKQTLPLLLTVNTLEVDVEKVRPGLDLILCIDISSSMSGTKLKMVKETLVFILDQLDEEDRVSLIAFDNEVEIKAKLNSMTEQNKV